MSDPNFHRRYFAQLTIYQILILIQIILVIISLRQFKTHAPAKKSRIMKWMYITVMSLGTTIFLVVEWYGLADFMYDFAAYPLYCTSAAILGATLLITYLFVLYMFYLTRLYSSFAQSAFALSKYHYKLLTAISITVYLILIVTVFIYQRSEPISIDFAWSGSTRDYKPIIICAGEFSIGLDIHIRIAMQIVIVIGNTFYGSLFWYKLQQIIKGMQAYSVSVEDKEISRKRQIFLVKLYKVIKIQTILVLLSTISTLIFWTCANVLFFFGSFAQVFVYVDISINCVCLWLMFAWNENIYHRYCICGRIVGATIFKCLKNKDLQRITEMKNALSSDEEHGKDTIDIVYKRQGTVTSTNTGTDTVSSQMDANTDESKCIQSDNNSSGSKTPS